MNRTAETQQNHLDSLLGEVVDEYLQKLANGERPDIDQYAEDHPEIASVIRQTFPALQVVNESMSGTRRGEGLDLSRSKQIGDFRLLHELGSGGMGFVYEAEQVSMGRRVALKILPMAGALQEKQLQRFRNEVRAAAMLDHPNIVSVYSVGEERGVHHYAMQLIRGQSLEQVIQELRMLRAASAPLSARSVHEVLSSAEGFIRSASACAPTEESSSQALSGVTNTRDFSRTDSTASHSSRLKSPLTIASTLVRVNARKSAGNPSGILASTTDSRCRTSAARAFACARWPHFIRSK